MTKAFDIALFVPTPASPQDGVVVDVLGPPFKTKFAPLVVGSKPGVVVHADMPAASAQNQIMLSGAGPNYDWGLAANPAAAATVPPPTAHFDMLMANATPAWATTSIDTVLMLGGAVTTTGGGLFVGAANLVFTPSGAAAKRIDGGDPAFSILDNFSWDAGTF